MIYLASKSARRRELLTKAKIPFKVIPSKYREKPIKNLTPPELVMSHALGKAMMAQTPKKNVWILGSDTIVVYGKKVFGKPKNKSEARRMLSLLSGHTHRVYTGICLMNFKKGSGVLDFAVTKVAMKRLSRKAIEAYHQKVNPLDKAGAYAIQAGPRIVKNISGSYSNVVGLPIELVRKMIRKIKQGKL